MLDKDEKYRLIQGDCLEVMPTLETQSIDFCLTDPPYGTTACKWDSVIPFEPMWKELKRLCKPKAAICLFGSQPFTSALVASNFSMFRYEWVWNKSHASGFQTAKRRPMRKHETINVFSQESPVYYPQMVKGEPQMKRIGKPESPRKNSDGTQGNIANLAKVLSDEYYPTTSLYFHCGVRAESVHPTQKPVELLRYLIRTYTQENEIVLDFTMGSGSTGVAAMLENRRFIGIEKEQKYFDIAKQRIESALQKEPLFQTV